MQRIKITSDSTCDLTPELLKQFDIDLMRLSVTLGEDNYIDGLDVTTNDLYKYVEDHRKLPKTAARSPADYEEFFRKYTAEGQSIIHFNVSSDLSSSYQNACIAAAEFEGLVEVIDSRNLSTGTALLILDAIAMIDAGNEDIHQIADAVRARCDLVRSSFVVDTLDYLKMGGRCSAVAALGANVLKLHPCIEVSGGKMGVSSKYRGPMARILPQYVTDKLTKTPNINYENIFITFTSCDAAIVRQVEDKVRELADFKNIYITEAGCTIASHCGQGTLGILFEVNA